MTLRVLSKRSEIARAAATLGQHIKGGAQFHRTVGHQGESGKHTLHWHNGAGVWGVQERRPNRLWQAFGLKHPGASRKLSIVVEINPPLAGINRQTGGVLLANDGAVFLGHRGSRFNQLPKDSFRKYFREGRAGRWVRVSDGKTQREVVVLGRIDRRRIVAAIAAFAREVRRIKKLVRPQMTSTG